MKTREHYAKKWYSIDSSLARQNIKDNSIVKCRVNGKEYFFNIPNEDNPTITDNMFLMGKWYIYTWAD